MKVSNNGLSLASDLRSFFEEECRSAIQKQGLQLAAPTHLYLASLLSRYALSEEYFVDSTDTPGRKEMPSVVRLWLESMSSEAMDQCRQMQFVGDVALFTSGFFPERLQRSMVDMDFYTAIGGQAYERAGQLQQGLTQERRLNVFFELSSKFTALKEVLAEVADRAHLGSDQGRLRLFERWLGTKNARLRRMLAENGILASAQVSDEGS